MKRMWTLEELTALIQEEAPGFDPSVIESGTILASSILGLDGDGELVKGNLYGKFVRILNASELVNPLTADQIDIIKEGVFIEGVLGKPYFYHKNPLLFPPSEYQGILYGIALGVKSTDDGSTGPYTQFDVYKYTIDASGNLAYNVNQVAIIGQSGGGTTSLSLDNLNGKNIPHYPSSIGTFVLKCIDGVLTWVEEV